MCNTEIEDRIVNERECKAVEKQLGRKLDGNVDELTEYGLLWESEDVDLMDREYRFLRDNVKVWDLVPLYAHLSVEDEWDRILGSYKDGIAKVIGFKTLIEGIGREHVCEQTVETGNLWDYSLYLMMNDVVLSRSFLPNLSLLLL